jgi:type II secretory pathway component GspD/PulD (secretin)
MTSISAKSIRIIFGFIILMMSVRSIQAADSMTFDMNKSAASTPAPAAAKALQSIMIDHAGAINFQGVNLAAPSVSKSKGKLVLKFKDTKLALTKTIAGSGLVKDIRSAIHGADAWVVIDEDNVSTYSFDTTSTGLKMSLTAASASAAAPKKKDESAATSGADGASAEAADVVPADSDKKSYSRLIDASLRPVDGALKIVLTADSPAKYTVRKLSTPEKLVVRFINTHLDVPENEQKIQGDATLTGKSGLLSMEIRQIGQNFSPISEAIVTIVPGTTYQIDRNLNQIVITLTAPPVVEKPVERSGNINTLISAEVAGADLSAVVRTLADEAGFDVDMSSAPVTGLVNEKFKNVPLKNALAVLLAPGNYTYEVQGNILRIGTQATLSASKKILPQITDIIQPAGGMTPAQLQTLVIPILSSSNAVSTEVDPVRNVLIVHGTASDVEEYKQALRDLKLEPGEETNRITRVVKLNYADPVTMMGILKTYLTPIGQVQVDSRTQDLIIWEVPENMGVLLELVKEIDIKQPQVLIESSLVDVSDEKDLSLGVNWTINKTVGDTINSTAGMLPTNLTGNIATAPQFTFGTVKDNASIQMELQALETKKKGKIISRPRIATASGVTAEIDTIQNVIVQTQTTTIGNGALGTVTTTFNQVPVPIILKVTPRITDDGRITTQIVVDVTSITGAAPLNGPPPTSVETAQTTLTTKNGETIVIGGLMHDTITEEDDGVPLLQDLPILGALFQSKAHVHQKEELIIFVTPTLIED